MRSKEIINRKDLRISMPKEMFIAYKIACADENISLSYKTSKLIEAYLKTLGIESAAYWEVERFKL